VLSLVHDRSWKRARAEKGHTVFPFPLEALGSRKQSAQNWEFSATNGNNVDARESHRVVEPTWWDNQSYANIKP